MSNEWRAIAAQVAEETDSQKLMRLVTELIDKLDEERRRPRLALLSVLERSK